MSGASLSEELASHSLLALRFQVRAVSVLAMAHQPGSKLVGLIAAPHEWVFVGDHFCVVQTGDAKCDEAAHALKHWARQDKPTAAIEL
jgi:hypothetical protein